MFGRHRSLDRVLVVTVVCSLLVFFTALCSAEDNRYVNPDLLRNVSVGPCDDDTWAYSNVTGSCYMYQTTFTPVDWQAAFDACTAMTTKSKLLFVEDAYEQDFLDEQLLRFNYEPHWIAAKRDGSGNFIWMHDNSAVTYTRWDTDEPNPAHDCVYMHRPDTLLATWKWKTGPCTDQWDVYCKEPALRCPPIPTAEFLEPNFPKPNIEQTITFKCVAGYQMPKYAQLYQEWVADTAANRTNASEPVYKIDPSLEMTCNYSAQWTNTTMAVAPCEPLSCDKVPVVKNAKANDTNIRVYPTWTQFKCNHGYYYKDINSRYKVGQCMSDIRWHNVPRECDPVPCPPFVKPGNSTSNNDHLTFFGDIISYRCFAGYMFPDGQVWQFVRCGPNFVNDLIGRWNETELEPCQILECPAAPTGANLYQIGNGTAHRTKINYTCNDGYEYPDGSVSMILECSDDAIWRPNLPKCSVMPKPLPTTGKKYTPPSVEAPGASSIGSTSMVICIIMLVILVLLDAATISRDIKLFKSNMRHFKRRLAGKRQHSNLHDE